MRSFAILRTNVGLTTNIKIMVDSMYNLSLSSIESNLELSDIRFKKKSFIKTNYFDELIPYFFDKIPASVAFDVKYDNDNSYVSQDFKDQYDEMYQYGARNIQNNKEFLEEFEYFAPIYLNKNRIPTHFMIFRVDGAGVGLLTKENFTNEISNRFKLVKTFDLGPQTPIGEWLNLNFRNNIYFPSTPLEIDFRELEFCKWNGIDYTTGGWCSKSYFIDDFLEAEQQIFEFEKFIYNSYKTNEVVFPNILNLSFLFDDTPSTPDVKRKWSLNRYYGFYVDSLEQVTTISPWIPPFLNEDAEILEGNVIFSPSSEDPFMEGFSDSRPFYVEYRGEYYKVEKFTEILQNQIVAVPQPGGLLSQQYVNLDVTKYRIISDVDLSGKQAELNLNFGRVNSGNYLITYQNQYLQIDSFDDWSVWLIEIDGIHHNLIKDQNGIRINSDYSFDFNENDFQYKIASENKIVSFVVDDKNPPKKFNIYRLNFTDIKDFDTKIIDTEYSKYEYEKENELTDTDESKMYVQNLNIKSEPRDLDDYIYKGEVVNIPVSSEYTANYETFKVNRGELSDIWRKNPVYCRWSFQNSISANDYPYSLNNSMIFEDFNRTTNPFATSPSRIERNLDYFYSINSSTSSYLHHSLHIEGFDYDYKLDTNYKFELDKYLNLATYSVGTNSFATYSLDYFSDFFYQKQYFVDGKFVRNCKKYSQFNSGDINSPNSTLFRGLKFNLYDVDAIEVLSEGEISNVNLSNNNTFDDYKFSILLSDNDKYVNFNGELITDTNSMNWYTIEDWRMDKTYATGSIVIFEDILYQAQSEVTTIQPVLSGTGSVNSRKTAPYNQNGWLFLDDPTNLLNPFTQSNSTKTIFWSPFQTYVDGDVVFNDGEFYYYDSTGTHDFWNPYFATLVGYNPNGYVLYKSKWWRSYSIFLNLQQATNKYPPDYSVPVFIPGSVSGGIFTMPQKATVWTATQSSTNPRWNPVDLWNPTNIYTTGDLVYHSSTIWQCVATASGFNPIVQDEPGITNLWQRKYSLEPDTDLVYNLDQNPIIRMNELYYLCSSNLSNSTLDNGIVIYVNKKWKNVLCNINISDNTLPYISNTDRDMLYHQLFTKLCANNFINSINDITNKFGFTDWVSYVIIDESGNITKHNYKNNLKSLSCMLRIEEPEELRIDIESFITTPVERPSKLTSNRRLTNGTINSISQINWYNEIPVAAEISENTKRRKTIKNYNSNYNIIQNIIYRYNGPYMPTFYDIQIFDKTQNGISENTKFDISLTDFALMKERKLSKVNRQGSPLQLKNEADVDSVFPMLDEFGYITRDFFIFSSTWDAQYHYETLPNNIAPQTIINQPTINSTTANQFGSPPNPINQNYTL